MIEKMNSAPAEVDGALSQPSTLWSISRRVETATRLAAYFCLFVVVIYAARYLFAMSTTSLWTDEFYSISRFSQKGFLTAWTDYHVPNNHILFNMIASLVPADLAYNPFWARLLSFLAVGLAFGVLLRFALQDAFFAGGVLIIGLIFLNRDSMDLILQARGYGFAFAAAIVQSIALYHFITSGTSRSRNLLLASAFVGGAVLPIYLPLSAIPVLCAFAIRPSWAFFRAAAITGIAGVGFYAPTTTQIIDYANIYADRWGKHYTDMKSVEETLEYIKPAQTSLSNLIYLSLLAGAVALLSRGWSAKIQLVLIYAMSFIVFVGTCLIMETPLVRTTQFSIAPLAILGIVLLAQKHSRLEISILQSALLCASLIWVGFNGVQNIRNWNFAPLEAWLGTAELAQNVSPDQTRFHVTFRKHQLTPYLDDPRRLISELDSNAFATGKVLVIDGNVKTLDRFDGTTISDQAINLDVPQRRRGRTRLAFVPVRTGALRTISTENIQGKGPDAPIAQALDRNPETRWSNRRPQMETPQNSIITFELEPEGSCRTFFWHSWNAGLPTKFDVVAQIPDRRDVDLRKKISSPSSDLMMIDLTGLNVESIQFNVRPDPRNRAYLTINEAWCGH